MGFKLPTDEAEPLVEQAAGDDFVIGQASWVAQFGGLLPASRDDILTALDRGEIAALGDVVGTPKVAVRESPATGTLFDDTEIRQRLLEAPIEVQDQAWDVPTKTMPNPRADLTLAAESYPGPTLGTDPLAGIRQALADPLADLAALADSLAAELSLDAPVPGPPAPTGTAPAAVAAGHPLDGPDPAEHAIAQHGPAAGTLAPLGGAGLAELFAAVEPPHEVTAPDHLAALHLAAAVATGATVDSGSAIGASPSHDAAPTSPTGLGDDDQVESLFAAFLRETAQTPLPAASAPRKPAPAENEPSAKARPGGAGPLGDDHDLLARPNPAPRVDPRLVALQLLDEAEIYRRFGQLAEARSCVSRAQMEAPGDPDVRRRAQVVLAAIADPHRR